MKCARCRRPLKHPVHVADMVFGAKCAAMLYGAKPRRRARAQQADERQAELFQEAQR